MNGPNHPYWSRPPALPVRKKALVNRAPWEEARKPRQRRGPRHEAAANAAYRPTQELEVLRCHSMLYRSDRTSRLLWTPWFSHSDSSPQGRHLVGKPTKRILGGSRHRPGSPRRSPLGMGPRRRLRPKPPRISVKCSTDKWDPHGKRRTIPGWRGVTHRPERSLGCAARITRLPEAW